jgi:nucleotidyltransferase/DNA polymerase involved in DNA repair
VVEATPLGKKTFLETSRGELVSSNCFGDWFSNRRDEVVCDNATNCRGRTVTVKIKWANFQISSRSRSIETPIETRDKLHELALELIRTVLPPQKGIRLVGVTLSNFRLPNTGAEAELPFREI